MSDSLRTAQILSAQNAPALGASVVYDIPRTADLEALHIALTGTIQLTTGATAIITDGICNIIESVDLITNGGRDVIASLKYSDLVQGNIFRRKHGKVPTLTQVGVGIAVHAFEVNAVLDMAAFGALRPKDSNLRENNYESLQLKLRFASDWTGVYTGGGFVATTFAPTLVVSTQETIELPDAAGKYSSPSLRPLMTSNDITLSGATNNHQFKLTPNQLLRGLVIKVTTNASPQVLSDALLSRIRVNVGKVQRLSLTSAAIKAQMKDMSATANLTGYYFVDLADGRGSPDKLSDTLDLTAGQTNGADSVVEIDTSAAAIVSVVQFGYVPIV